MTADPCPPTSVRETATTTETAVQPGIVVVDDDKSVLALLGIVLASRGFQVWTAPTGSSALDLYQQHQAAVNLVLLDVCMPGMDGPQTLAELRRINPGVRAAFMSGYTGKYTPDELVATGMLRFFDKPFQIQPLADQLWQLATAEVRCSA